MADREKILRYFKAGGDEQLAAKLLDLAEGANKSRKFRVSEFLDPHAYNVAEIIAANYENVRLESDGGFSNAERVKAAFVADDFYGQPDFGMAYFLAAWDKRYYDLSHRDILGAFMGTGCKREALGDIVFVPEGAQFVVEKSLVNYLTGNLTQIGSAPVTLTEIPREELLQKEEKVKLINATVADLRLDAVAAAGYGAVGRAVLHDHARLAELVQPGTADCVLFNFGWLPGAEHDGHSTADGSVPALRAALEALRPGGVLAAVLYSGKVIGDAEKQAALAFFKALPLTRYTVLVCEFANWAQTAPLPCFVIKK